MKKTFEAPMLIKHGSVESLTRWSGTVDTDDFLFFNGDPVTNPATGQPGTGDGSHDADLMVVPRP
jgi:hypothetical protein